MVRLNIALLYFLSNMKKGWNIVIPKSDNELRLGRVRDHTGLKIAKFRAETVNGGGEVIELGRVRGRR